MLSAGSEARNLAQGVAVAAWIHLAIAAPLLLARAAVAGDETSKAPARSERQEMQLDLTIDFDAMYANQPCDGCSAEPGNGRTARDLPPRVNWSRRVGKSWELDPVLLHRRQAGQPERQGDDFSNKTIGIELRRQF